MLRSFAGIGALALEAIPLAAQPPEAHVRVHVTAASPGSAEPIVGATVTAMNVRGKTGIAADADLRLSPGASVVGRSDRIRAGAVVTVHKPTAPGPVYIGRSGGHTVA